MHLSCITAMHLRKTKFIQDFEIGAFEISMSNGKGKFEIVCGIVNSTAIFRWENYYLSFLWNEKNLQL